MSVCYYFLSLSVSFFFETQCISMVVIDIRLHLSDRLTDRTNIEQATYAA